MGDSEVDPKRFRRIDQLLDSIFQMDSDQIPAFLDQACAGDDALRTEVERLIALEKRDRLLMNAPAFNAAVELLREDQNNLSSQEIGPTTLFSLLNEDSNTLLKPRQLIAGRYEVLSRLGKGGMGEVWHAYDVKLRVNVALKSLRHDLKGGQDPLELLRSEVRVAREVISPNVCRIFDLVSEGDVELISMEHIDGTTLLELMKEKGPLPLRDARDIAAQFLAGLDAIHSVGLVHRDLKPENIMITRSGRVVVMDLGIAQPQAQSGGAVTGTLPYMSPEQLAGEPVDARSDIFSAGIVLAEMIHTKGTRSKDTREMIWQAIRKNPEELPDSEWKAVIVRAVAPQKQDRFSSAIELTYALEETTARSETVEDRLPYPGLSSFSSGDAEYFFGREQEVETLIRKLQQLHFMALIGPSGAGKTSLVQAGLIPALPQDWGRVIFYPGGSPVANLQQSLAPLLSQDDEGQSRMIHFEKPDTAIWILKRLRQSFSEFVLIVDRFEELFTLSTYEVQSQFAEFLARATLEANVRILLVMRDDFFTLCKEHPALAPIFSEPTAMLPLSGASLRRALVQPALKCGYRFEDENLVYDILSDVEKERGALPLLAFAASLLWEKRDRGKAQLTREAYKAVGEVRGALARHAENTIQEIGTEIESVVREIFRNLITAQHTRIARDTEELLSVFPSEYISTAKEVLLTFINARLITSSENRIEITHESLITNWPRLVKWQAQDAESAQLRDELRQAAQLWNQKGRPEDLVWAGAAYLEFQLWRERYPGGLTTIEDDFARAMNHKANKKRRQKRILATTIFVVLLITLAVIGDFWRKESIARNNAVVEARNAQASKLLVMGRSEPEPDRALRIAHVIASLEITDSQEARQFALQVLSQGQPAFTLVKTNFPAATLFSPDDKWFVVHDYMRFGTNEGLQLFARDGSAPILVTKTAALGAQFTPNSKFIVWVNSEDPRVVQVWSIPERKIVRTFTMPGETRIVSYECNRVLLRTITTEKPELAMLNEISNDGNIQFIANYNREFEWFSINKQGSSIAYQKHGAIYFRSIGKSSIGPEKVLIKAEAKRGNFSFHPNGKFFIISDEKQTRIYPVIPNAASAYRILPVTGSGWFDWTGRYIGFPGPDNKLLLWDLTAPADAEPTIIQHPDNESAIDFIFDHHAHWMAVPWGDTSAIQFYPLTKTEPLVFHGKGTGSFNIRFASDGKSLINGFTDGVQVFNIDSKNQTPTRTIFKPPAGNVQPIDLDPSGKYLLVGTNNTEAYWISIADGKSMLLKRGLPERIYDSVAISPDGLSGAGVAVHGLAEQHGIEIWNFESNTVHVIEQSKGKASFCVKYAPDGSLFSGDTSGNLYQWNLRDGSHKVWKVGQGIVTAIAITKDGHYVATVSLSANKWNDVQSSTSEVFVHDLKNNSHSKIQSHGNRVFSIAFDPAGKKVVTGDLDGIVRVGSISGETPHLLMGHQQHIADVTVDPSGKWIASTEYNKSEVRLWLMPEGQPLQTLPHDELLSYLRKLTNVRVTADKNSSNGYRVEILPFSGW